MTNIIRHEAQRVRGRESGGDRGHGRHLETYIKFFERSHPVSVPVILFISYSVSAFISDSGPIPDSIPDTVTDPITEAIVVTFSDHILQSETYFNLNLNCYPNPNLLSVLL